MPRTPSQIAHARFQQETRRALGLCLTCGKERGSGSTQTRCAPCREKQRRASQRYNDAHREQRRAGWKEHAQRTRDDRTAAALCPGCGKRPPLPDQSLCAPCHEDSRARDARHRDKERRAQTPGYTGDPKTYAYRLGSERPTLDGSVHRLRFALDAWAYLNLMTLMKDQREQERAGGQYPRVDGLSLLVRQCILQHPRGNCPVHRQTDEMHEHRLGVSLDDRTLALLDAHAARHYPDPDGGPPNRSAALRDFLIAAHPRPKWVARVGGPRRYPDIEEKLSLSDRIMKSHRANRT